MAGTFTPNYNFVLQGAGDNVGTWGTTGAGPSEPGLNSGIFQPIDSILGGSLPVSLSSGNNFLSGADWLNKNFVVTGSSVTATLVLPLSASPTTPGDAVGGSFVVTNNTTGSSTVFVKTANVSSSGVFIPQGFATILFSDKVNVSYVTVGLPAFVIGSSGDPNGALAGTATSVNTNTELAYDTVNNTLSACTFTGPATGGPGVQAVWTNVASSTSAIPQLEGRLTPISNTPVVPSDTTSTTIYYTPYTGAWAAYHNGSSIVPFRFSQMPLTLTTTQPANSVLDVYLAYNGGTPVIGTGPPWSSLTARGGSVDIQRNATTGLWVNAATINVTYNTGSGNTIINGVAGRFIYLGSIFTDLSAAGSVSCYVSWGNSGPRRYGVWNAYNRVRTALLVGDSTASWVYGTNAYRQSNANTNNKAQTFFGLQEEIADCEFNQFLNTTGNRGQIGIGINSTTVASGFNPNALFPGAQAVLTARLIVPPSLGVTNIICLESASSNGNETFNGTQANMYMSVISQG